MMLTQISKTLMILSPLSPLKLELSNVSLWATSSLQGKCINKADLFSDLMMSPCLQYALVAAVQLHM